MDDANDQAPMFQSNTYTETINEDWPIGERVLVVTATDKDIGTNAELSYGLKSECLVRKSIYTGNDEQDCVGGVREPKYFKVVWSLFNSYVAGSTKYIITDFSLLNAVYSGKNLN